jgi:hypothetical protein
METHAFGFRLRANAQEGQKRFPISMLRESGAKVPGFVLNGLPTRHGGYYYHYHVAYGEEAADAAAQR